MSQNLECKFKVKTNSNDVMENCNVECSFTNILLKEIESCVNSLLLSKAKIADFTRSDEYDLL